MKRQYGEIFRGGEESKGVSDLCKLVDLNRIRTIVRNIFDGKVEKGNVQTEWQA